MKYGMKILSLRNDGNFNISGIPGMTDIYCNIMRSSVFFITFILFAMTACKSGPMELTDWTMYREGDDVTYDVRVPCTVAGALNEAGVFGGDVLHKDNYAAIDKSQFDSTWVFETEFNAEKGLCHVLRFEGIGYYADIYVNDVRIASSDTTYGAFCIREYDVTDIVKRRNRLVVKVNRAVKGDINVGYVDWNPRPLDESMGIFRPVTLISTPDVMIKDLFVKPVVDPSDLSSADLEISAVLVNLSDRSVRGCFTGRYEDRMFESEVELAAGESRKLTVTEHVDDPRIWWSRDLGIPEMYRLDVDFRTDAGISAKSSTGFGIRSITSEIDEYGHRQFILNGRKVLLKSAGWTDHIFMQDTRGNLESQIAYVCDMGLNSIRFENIWGKDHTVYDLCDSLGLMAMAGWSCQWEWEDYCGLPETDGYGCINDPESEALAIRYFRDQVLWLRNHPSVIAWLTGSDRIPNPHLEEEYIKIYEELEYRPYVCSAKGITSTVTGPSGTKMEGPYEYVGPDFWYKDRNTGGAYGFNTETGVGLNIPQFESVRRMLGEENLWPLNKVWNYHCTASSSRMNTTDALVEAMTGQYGEAVCLEDFMRKAHAMDYDATRAMFEAFRCNLPRTTGVVQWMLNSAWPSLYWQLYDYYLVPTAGYYGVKKACAPVQMIYNYADGKVYVVNETLSERTLTARMTVYDPASALVDTKVAGVTSTARVPQAVFDVPAGDCFIYLELLDENGDAVADNFYCIPAEGNGYDWDNADWCVTPVRRSADMTFVSELPSVSLEMDVERMSGGFKVTLANRSDKISYQNILKAKDRDGELIPAVIWSDNFLSLCPGQTKVILCRLPEDVEDAEIHLEGWNLCR